MTLDFGNVVRGEDRRKEPQSCLPGGVQNKYKELEATSSGRNHHIAPGPCCREQRRPALFYNGQHPKLDLSQQLQGQATSGLPRDAAEDQSARPPPRRTAGRARLSAAGWVVEAVPGRRSRNPLRTEAQCEAAGGSALLRLSRAPSPGKTPLLPVRQHRRPELPQGAGTQSGQPSAGPAGRWRREGRLPSLRPGVGRVPPPAHRA